VKCETIDLVVPATAEIVIEGEIPTDRMVPDPASGEHTGYMIINRMVYGFDVKCITHRKNPIWHDYISQMPPSESSTIRGIGSEGRMISFLKDACGIPQIKDVAFHHCAGAWRMCVIRFRDMDGIRTPNSVIWQALSGALAINTDWPKIVIAVDEDIDPWDLESVFWAVTFRYQPHRDTRIVQGRNSSIDQSIGLYSEEEESQDIWFPTSRVSPQGASAILMDATRKWAYTPTCLPKRNYMQRAKEIWQELGFPALKMREPWHGIELGLWPEKYQRQAELAEKGDFDEVAKELLAGTKPMPFKTRKP
jgi:3-polyprenyl-4-hydroxybenzoate decarboxylase